VAGIRLILTLQQQLLMDEISAVGLEMDLVLRKLLWNVRLVPILQALTRGSRFLVIFSHGLVIIVKSSLPFFSGASLEPTIMLFTREGSSLERG